MKEVPSRVIEPGERALVAVKILRLLHATQREPRGASRLVRCHASALKLIFEQRDVSGELTREIVLRASGA